MTTFLARRRRPAAPARPRIVGVSNYWRCAGPQQGRQVTLRMPDGALRPAFVPDEHPALVAFLAARSSAAVAA